MNITHAIKENITEDAMEAIFTRQSELMGKYHDIEKRSGLLQTENVPVNLHDKRGQARIKDFAWRITEELGEALDAKENEAHFKEELIDGLHFLTELTILAGENPSSVIQEVKALYNPLVTGEGDGNLEVISSAVNAHYSAIPFDTKVAKFIEHLGMMCNCLKNKPWKQSNMITDVKAFKKQLAKVWVSYMAIILDEVQLSEVVDIYFKKSQVNKFRQRSNY